ncbi:M10 family metallopeptidase C-terminal domain-containing protein [Pseudomonas poae]|nr:M10 family metallopeptidase C-terminal domain-containing protein [Pseudomonas poae]
MSGSSRLHNYSANSRFPSTVNAPAPNVFDRGWAGPGSANPLSFTGGNQQGFGGFARMGDVMSLFARTYMEFQQAFARYVPWAGSDPRPAPEPKPSLKPAVAACPAPEPEPCPRPVLEPAPKPEPCPRPVLEPAPKPEPCPQPVLKPEPCPQPAQHSPGDTRYGFNSNTGNTQTSLVSAYDEPWFNVKDTEGNDTLDFSGFKQHQIINLGTGTYSSVGGMANNVYISRNSKIENAVGGSGNDRIIGNASDNVLVGGEGADTLSGGGGSNVFKYNAAADSSYSNADLLTDFKSGWDKIDLCDMANAAGVRLNLVHSFTGRPGDTVIKYNANSGRYFLAVDMSGDRRSDFLIKSTRPFGPEDVIGLS